jgi:hypothetical protein
MSFTFLGPETASVLFANSGGTRGYLGDATGLPFPVTIACFAKYTNHPAAAGYAIEITSTNSTLNGMAVIQTGTAGDNWRALSTNSTAGSSNATVVATDGTYDNVWTPLVAIFAGSGTTTCTSRTMRVNTYANTTTTATSNDAGANLKYFFAGEAPTGGGDIAAMLLAEFAIWRIALAQTEIEGYMAGTSADQLSASDLIGYYSLRDDLTQTGGIWTIGTLGNDGGAAQNADHPSITTPSVGVAPSLFVARSNLRLN